MDGLSAGCARVTEPGQGFDVPDAGSASEDRARKEETQGSNAAAASACPRAAGALSSVQYGDKTGECNSAPEVVACVERTMELELTITVFEGRFAICRLNGDAGVPDWAKSDRFVSVTRTPEELSVVCPQDGVPAGVTCEGDWRCLQVAGPLDLSLVGILASLTAVLAGAGVSVFAVSTFDTDYLLVRESDLVAADRALRAAGHMVSHSV